MNLDVYKIMTNYRRRTIHVHVFVIVDAVEHTMEITKCLQDLQVANLY